jgi:hypothetical protein
MNAPRLYEYKSEFYLHSYTYGTFIGGLMSVVIVSLLLIYAIFLFMNLVNRDNIMVRSNILNKNLFDDNDKVKPGEYGFSFAVSWESGYNQSIQQSFIDINLYQVTVEVADNNYDFVKNKTLI